MSNKKRGRPVGDREGRKKEILVTVVDLLAEFGHRGVSLRKISAEIGCTTGTMTYYFKNKEQVIIAVSDYIFKEFEIILVKDGRCKDIEDILNSLFEWSQTEKMNVINAFSELLVYSKNSIDFSEHLREKYRELKTNLENSLTEAQSIGKVRDDIHSSLLSEQLISLIDGWLVLQSIEKNGLEPQNMKQFLNTTFKLISKQK